VLFTLDGEGEPVQRMELNLSTKVIQTLWSIVIIHKKNVYYKVYYLNRVGGAMISVFTSSEVDSGFEP